MHADVPAVSPSMVAAIEVTTVATLLLPSAAIPIGVATPTNINPLRVALARDVAPYTDKIKSSAFAAHVHEVRIILATPYCLGGEFPTLEEDELV